MTSWQAGAKYRETSLSSGLYGWKLGVTKWLPRFARAIESLLGRSVDVITEEQIRNPYFREAVDEQRVTIYEARNREAAA